jgi:carbonic anhydrase/acetyltransferase-like protein (isoleucine patch superfamily)
MLYALGFDSPVSVSGEYFVAPTAAVIGRVYLGRGANVWFGAVLRGDTNEITIGDATNVQDNAVVHVDDDAPARLGDNVTVGHSAVVHGCTVGAGSLIGIGATILSHAEIGQLCIVGAGALVTERKRFPDRSLIIGAPAKRVREVTDEEVEMLRQSAAHYAALGRRYHDELKRL